MDGRVASTGTLESRLAWALHDRLDGRVATAKIISFMKYLKKGVLKYFKIFMNFFKYFKLKYFIVHLYSLCAFTH